MIVGTVHDQANEHSIRTSAGRFEEQEKVGQSDAELEGERARREIAEVQEKALRAQIAKEAKVQQLLKVERDRALTEVGELKAAVEEREKALQAQITEQANTEQGLITERDRAFAEVAELKATVEGFTRARPDAEAHPPKAPTKRWLTAISIGIALLAVAVSVFLSAKADDADKAREAIVSEVKRLANGNDSNAMVEMGYLYDQGVGVKQDYAEAKRWYEKAAQAGESIAMYDLGLQYLSGHGVTPSYAQAKSWFEQAARLGDSSAMIQLGDQYKDGLGVTKSVAEARKWYQKAADAGSPDAQRRLDALPK
jgi:TPR repeat protein